MKIISKLVEIKAELPVDNHFIEKRLKEIGIKPLKWAVVNVENNILTLSLTGEDYGTML